MANLKELVGTISGPTGQRHARHRKRSSLQLPPVSPLARALDPLKPGTHGQKAYELKLKLQIITTRFRLRLGFPGT